MKALRDKVALNGRERNIFCWSEMRYGVTNRVVIVISFECGRDDDGMLLRK